MSAHDRAAAEEPKQSELMSAREWSVEAMRLRTREKDARNYPLTYKKASDELSIRNPVSDWDTTLDEGQFGRMWEHRQLRDHYERFTNEELVGFLRKAVGDRIYGLSPSMDKKALVMMCVTHHDKIIASM